MESTIKEGHEKHRKTTQNFLFPNAKIVKKEKISRETSQNYYNTGPTIISKQPSAHLTIQIITIEYAHAAKIFSKKGIFLID